MSVPHKRQSLNDFEHRLTQPMVLEDGRPPKVLTSTLNTLSCFVVIAILWGALTSVQTGAALHKCCPPAEEGKRRIVRKAVAAPQRSCRCQKRSGNCEVAARGAA